VSPLRLGRYLRVDHAVLERFVPVAPGQQRGGIIPNERLEFSANAESSVDRRDVLLGQQLRRACRVDQVPIIAKASSIGRYLALLNLRTRNVHNQISGFELQKLP
jgi:hypothetical protein